MPVHLRGRQRQRRRVQPDVALAVALDERARVPRVRLDVQDARRVGVEHRIGRDRVEVGHAHHGRGDRSRARRGRLPLGTTRRRARRRSRSRPPPSRRRDRRAARPARARRRRANRSRSSRRRGPDGADERRAAQVRDLVRAPRRRPAGARSRRPPARRCRRPAGPPWRRSGSIAAPCPTSSRSGRCAAGSPRCRR